jgi:aconitate hydratase
VFAEKILSAHATDPDQQEFVRGKSLLFLRPDRVAMQDATAQMALLQFMLAGRDTAAVDATIHCDHLVVAKEGAARDLEKALETNREVYDFLRTAAARYGIGFWKPGSGIIHQIVLENYAFPGGLMIGTDSHTPNAGGLGMIAVGVGGSDAAEVMAGLPWEVKCPKVLGVRLTGKLNGWASAKDVIIWLCGQLTVKGGTNRIVEYFGPGASTISCTGKATITNMGAEIGATASLFPFDEKMAEFLSATGRSDIANLAASHKAFLAADPEVEKDPCAYYDEVVEIDLSTLEPYVAGPHTPDLVRPISAMAKEIKQKGYPAKVSAALIGSCTNSSYEDLGRAAALAAQAKQAGIRVKGVFFISPGSAEIEKTARRDGQLNALEAIGGVVLANVCGPCIGQWRRTDVPPDEDNTILTSFNRNFKGRNDGNPGTFAFIASPEIVTAYALAGDLSFNPAKDALMLPDGKKILLSPPRAPELPREGYEKSLLGFAAPLDLARRKKIEIVIDEKSERLQRLEPFAPWDGKDLENLPVLLKAKGKCTTDHISPDGQWLRFRGHLDKISDNMLLGAVNAFTGVAGQAKNILKAGPVQTPAGVAREYKKAGMGWVLIGDENYGEGSSREHAAMSPRFLGCRAVIARSFARIHETNLKKQGVVALTFEKPADYEKICDGDRLSVYIKGKGGRPFDGERVPVTVHHADGKQDEIETVHSYTAEQAEWFKTGSALNVLP